MPPDQGARGQKLLFMGKRKHPITSERDLNKKHRSRYSQRSPDAHGSTYDILASTRPQLNLTGGVPCRIGRAGMGGDDRSRVSKGLLSPRGPYYHPFCHSGWLAQLSSSVPFHQAQTNTCILHRLANIACVQSVQKASMSGSAYQRWLRGLPPDWPRGTLTYRSGR